MSATTSTILETVSGNFNFEVKKFPLTGPDNCHTPLYGLFRDDNFGLVGSKSVTAKYVPHTVDDVLCLVESTESAFAGCDVQCHFNDGHYVTIAPGLEYRKSVYGTADDIWPRITISAGYDGEAFRVMAGYYRDACANMAILKTVRSCVQKISHNGRLRDRMEELKRGFEGLKEGWTNLTDVIDRMEQAPVDLANFLNQIYPVPTADKGRDVTIHQNRTTAIFHALAKERAAIGKSALPQSGAVIVSAWEAYNAIQGYVQHKATRKGLPKAQTNRACDYGRIVAAIDDTTVAKAERLALALAG